MKYFLILFFFLYSSLYAQTMTHEKIASSYIYNFALNTQWPDGIKNEKFEIYLLSSNKRLLSTFTDLLKGQRLHGKEIHLTLSPNSKIPFSANLVYVDEDSLQEYKQVFDAIEGRPVLLVSHSYDNQRLVMINLTPEEEGRHSFEINKANILNQGLNISPKMILLGGTELDVAKLYKGAKDSLLKVEKELQSQMQKVKDMDKTIAQSQTTTIALQKEIQDKNQKLSDTQKQLLLLNADRKGLETMISKAKEELKRSQEAFVKQLEAQQKILKEEKASTQKIRDDYLKANVQLDQMSSVLLSQQAKLSSQEKEVKEKEYKLSTLTQKVSQKALEFQDLQDNLASQGKTIDTQQDLLFMLGTTAFIFLILVFIIFRTLKRESATNKALQETEKALKEQVIQTNKANASKTKFLAHMSHELRTPLNAVLGYSQLLQKDPSLSDKNQNTLRTINRSGEHLLSLINDVLEVSKIETGHISIDPIAFDLHVFLEDIFNMFEPRLNNEGLSFEVNRPDDLSQFICADINKLRQIFLNIIGNSVKFTAHGGIKVSVEENAEKKELLIAFEDSGEGIDTKEIDKLFKPFEQTISGKLGGGGAGLGLSIVQEYVHLMGGEIKVKSQLSFGTTFYLKIPFEPASASKVEQSPHKEVQSLREEDMGIEVLIADDNKTNNELLFEILSRIGFHVTAVENGIEALASFKTMRQKIILMDIQMPVMDGHQTLKAIKALDYGKDTPVIAVTASVFGGNYESGRESGFNMIIRKPFKDYEIYDAIAKLLQIEYVYKNETKEDDLEEKRSFSGLDESLKEKLIDAASRMKISRINTLIEEMETEFPKEALWVRELTEELDYERLLSLLQQK